MLLNVPSHSLTPLSVRLARLQALCPAGGAATPSAAWFRVKRPAAAAAPHSVPSTVRAVESGAAYEPWKSLPLKALTRTTFRRRALAVGPVQNHRRAPCTEKRACIRKHYLSIAV